jgi:GGDEF domain-containing protein
LFPETTSDEVKYIVSRIRLNLAKDLPNITMSIGVITSKGCDCLSADKLLHDADMLMYDVKRSTKNNVLFKQVEVNPPV